MFSGRIFHCPQWQMRLTMTGSGEPPFPESVVGWKGALSTAYTPDLLIAATGIQLESEANVGSLSQRRFLLAIPSLGVAEVRTYSGAGPSESVLTLLGLELYARHTGTWRLKWSGMEWRINGSLGWSQGAGQLDSPMPMTPASLPLLGIPPLLEGSTTCDSLIGSGCLPGGSGDPVTSQVQADITGGWRFHDGQSWVSLPVTLNQGDAPGAQPTMAALSGTTTWDLTVHCFGSLASSASSQSQIFGEGWILACPDLSRQVVRLTQDPAALISRGGFPRCRQTGGRTWWTDDCSFQPLDSGSETTEGLTLHSHTEMLEVVGLERGIIEDPLVPSLPAPCGRGAGEIWNGVSSFGGRSRSVTFGPYLDQGDDVLPILRHPDWRAVWVNTWLSPHWSFFFWLPPEEDAGPFAWPALGEDEASPELYWLPLRQQMLRHPALPSVQDTSQRTSVILEPLDQNGLTGLVAGQYLGRRSCWWGVPRFEAFPFLDRAQEQACLDQPEFWTFDSGEVKPSGLELTGPWAEAHLARWDAPPFRAIEGMKRLTLPIPENAASFQWKLVSADGTSTNLPPGPQDIPWSKGRKGAGSWAQDFGALLGTDAGLDSKPAAMISNALFHNHDRLQSLGLSSGREGVRLRLEAAPLNPELPVTCAFPTFERSPWEDVLWVAERSAAFALLNREGPGIRWGDLTWWNCLTDSFADPPLPKGVPCAMTALDLLCQRRVSLEGIGPEEGLDDEIASLFVQGEEYVQRAHLARDPFTQALVTHACVLPGESGPVGVIQNTYRSVPPLSHFPHLDRDSDLAPTSFYTAKTWTATQLTHWCIAPAPAPEKKAEMRFSGSPEDLLDREQEWEGWSIRGHARASDGLEGLDFTLLVEGRPQGRVRPYRGFFILPWPDTQFKQVWCSVLPWGHLHRTTSQGGGVAHERFLDSWVLPDASSQIDPLGEQGRTVILPERGTLLAAWVREGAVLAADSWDDGETWTEPCTMIENAFHPTLAALPDGRVILIAFRPDPADDEVGTLVARWKDSGGAEWSPEATLMGEAGPLRVQKGGFHAVYLPEGAARLALTALPEGEEGPAFWWSADEGRTWTRGVE